MRYVVTADRNDGKLILSSHIRVIIGLIRLFLIFKSRASIFSYLSNAPYVVELLLQLLQRRWYRKEENDWGCWVCWKLIMFFWNYFYLLAKDHFLANYLQNTNAILIFKEKKIKNMSKIWRVNVYKFFGFYRATLTFLTGAW